MNINPFNLQNNPSEVYHIVNFIGEERGTERSSNLPKVSGS